jgi:rhodanese-related sulfurtransferase
VSRRSLFLVSVVAPAIVVVMAACSDGAAVREVEAVTPAEGSLLMHDMGDRLTVIDVRTPDEFAASHLDGAINIDLEGGQFSTLIEALPKNEAYLVYCRSGRRSALAAQTMVNAGFTNVRDMGGIADWESAGYPTVSG